MASGSRYHSQYQNNSGPPLNYEYYHQSQSPQQLTPTQHAYDNNNLPQLAPMRSQPVRSASQSQSHSPTQSHHYGSSLAPAYYSSGSYSQHSHQQPQQQQQHSPQQQWASNSAWSQQPYHTNVTQYPPQSSQPPPNTPTSVPTSEAITFTSVNQRNSGSIVQASPSQSGVSSVRNYTTISPPIPVHHSQQSQQSAPHMSSPLPSPLQHHHPHLHAMDDDSHQPSYYGNHAHQQRQREMIDEQPSPPPPSSASHTALSVLNSPVTSINSPGLNFSKLMEPYKHIVDVAESHRLPTSPSNSNTGGNVLDANTIQSLLQSASLGVQMINSFMGLPPSPTQSPQSSMPMTFNLPKSSPHTQMHRPAVNENMEVGDDNGDSGNSAEPDGSPDVSTAAKQESGESSVQQCMGCEVTNTPEWRRGPKGPRTLCNACGLVYAKILKKRQREQAKANGQSHTGQSLGQTHSSNRRKKSGPFANDLSDEGEGEVDSEMEEDELEQEYQSPLQ